MALDHGRLDVENKFLENKSGRIFTFDINLRKSCQQIWVRANQPFILFIITSEVKECYEALFLSYRLPELRQLAVSFTIFKD